MAATLLFAVPFLLIPLISPVSALPNVTVTQIGPGDCSAYPNSYFHTGDNADAFIFTPDQADNDDINGLKTGISGTSLVVYEDSTVTETIFCCNGGIVFDGFGVRSLLLSTNSSNQGLSYSTQGVNPVPYEHDIDGVKQDGVFLGAANVTTWAFRPAADDSGYYQIRLLAPVGGNSTGENLYDGEFKGFLKIQAP